jgi:cell division protein FtsZ
MSVGFADGPDASRRSAEMAVGSPLLSRPLSSAREIIFSITGGPPLTLFQVNEVAAIIKQAAHPDANLIFGCQLDDDMGSGIQIVLYANDFA